MWSGWLCFACRRSLRKAWINLNSVDIHQKTHLNCYSTVTSASRERLDRIRNIGIIAHIDAGKTTTTERMLYYSGYTRRIGDVDEGSTVTDFLPAERARGITIQSAAITFHWPPDPVNKESANIKSNQLSEQHTLNLIDTPGHADFTFEVIRSLRILDGAICILDGVAGVEAQTEKVWHQATNYKIPRMIYVNKLDRDGASFQNTVKDIATRLHTFPVLCQIPWWREGKFVGVGDAVHLQGLGWSLAGDGKTFNKVPFDELVASDTQFADELRNARVALGDALSEHDEALVEAFLDAEDDWLKVDSSVLLDSLRKCLLLKQQTITPVFAGASFRNIGVQPLMDAINRLFPSPKETVDPDVTLGKSQHSLRNLIANPAANKDLTGARPEGQKIQTTGFSACALAFKVVSDPRRGVLVYVRVYHGSITRNALLFNTNLSVSEKAPRLLRMYASDAVEIESIDEGQIGVIVGLKHTRTGDTLISHSKSTLKTGPPKPLNTMQLRPVDVPPPLFMTSIEPHSFSEEKHLKESLDTLLREDPSLHVSIDAESGQTHLAGMGELHLEIARDRLLEHYKVKASMGPIEIGYRETVTVASPEVSETFNRDIAGKPVKATCQAAVSPNQHETSSSTHLTDHIQVIDLPDNNRLIVHHPSLSSDGLPTDGMPRLPGDLQMPDIINALRTGTLAAIARGPEHYFPMHSIEIRIKFDHNIHLGPTSSSAAISSAARLAVNSALKESSGAKSTILMEPYMLATIAVGEEYLGEVIHDLNSARNAQIISMNAEEDAGDEQLAFDGKRLTQQQLGRVYAPPDPFGNSAVIAGTFYGNRPRQIRARVPLKEMVGYLKHLRSLTGGRGTFVMEVDRFEKMNTPRMKAALTELRGTFA